MRHHFRASALLRPLNGLVLPAILAAAVGCTGVVGSDEPGDTDGTHDDGDDGASGDTDGDGDDDLTPTGTGAGSVWVTLHPGATVEPGAPTVVTVGAPFAPAALVDASLIFVRDADGVELPSHARELLPWRAWPGSDAPMTPSVRAAEVSVEVTFAELAPMSVELVYGGDAASVALAAPADPQAAWVPVTDGEMPDGTVTEPPVYAAFPAEWLGECLLRSRAQPMGTDTRFAWLDDAVVGFAHTAVNDVPDSVVERLNYTTDYEPWLFDRTATLFGVYVRTGDVQWLRHAHRSAQFYLAHLSQRGYFDIKETEDLKYSYGRSLLMDFVFTGDPALLDGIERVAAAGEEWDPTYDLETNFWTERHQTYALLAALSAWEATGSATHSDRAADIARISFALASDPVGSWQNDGCMLHGMEAHEGAGGTTPVCSPWMSALFADAVWEYYVQTHDAAALTFLAELGRFVTEFGLYEGGDGLDYTMPWYLSSSETQFSDEGPWGDIEHTCDVAGLVTRAAWARTELGQDGSALRAVASDLLVGCEYNLAEWHRPAAPSTVGKSEWRLSPGRKFNWWFGTTSDMTWLTTAME
jgi:hypothetical protein